MLIVLANIYRLILNKRRKEDIVQLEKINGSCVFFLTEHTRKKKKKKTYTHEYGGIGIRKEMFGSIHEPVSFVATCNERRATKHIARVSSRRLNLSF